MQNLSPSLAKAFNIEQRGAVVSKITKGLPADKAGLQVGDIVTTVNGRPVNDATTVRTTAELERAIKDNSKRMLLNIRRGNDSMFIVT